MDVKVVLQRCLKIVVRCSCKRRVLWMWNENIVIQILIVK